MPRPNSEWRAYPREPIDSLFDHPFLQEGQDPVLALSSQIAVSAAASQPQPSGVAAPVPTANAPGGAQLSPSQAGQIPLSQPQQHPQTQPQSQTQPQTQPQAPPHPQQSPATQIPQHPNPQLGQQPAPQLPQSSSGHIPHPQAQLPQSSPPQPTPQQQPQTVHTPQPPHPQSQLPPSQPLSPGQPSHPSPQGRPPTQIPLPLPNPPFDPDTLSPAGRRRLRLMLRRARQSARRTRVGVRPAAPPPERRRPVDPAALDKKTARVIRNREVALRARQAAKDKLHHLESENNTLRNRAGELEIENSTLKLQIESLRRGGAGGAAPGAWDFGVDAVVRSVGR